MYCPRGVVPGSGLELEPPPEEDPPEEEPPEEEPPEEEPPEEDPPEEEPPEEEPPEEEPPEEEPPEEEPPEEEPPGEEPPEEEPPEVDSPEEEPPEEEPPEEESLEGESPEACWEEPWLPPPLEPPEEPGLSGEEPRLPALSWEPLSGSSPPPEEPPWDWEDSTSPGQAVTSWGGSLPISIRAQARERAAVAREAFLAAPLFFQNWNFIFTSLSVAGVFPVSAENGAVKMVTAREAWDKAKLLAEKTAPASRRRWKGAAIGPRPLEKGRQQAL